MAIHPTNKPTSSVPETLLIRALVRLDVESVATILTSNSGFSKDFVDTSWDEMQPLRPLITLPLAWDILINRRNIWKSNKVIDDITQKNATIKQLLTEYVDIDWGKINRHDTPDYLASTIDTRTDDQILLEILNKNLYDARRHYLDIDLQLLLTVMRMDKEKAIYYIGKGASLAYNFDKVFRINDYLKSRINTNTKLLAHLTKDEHHRSFRGDIVTDGKEILINTAACSELYYALNNIATEQINILKQYSHNKGMLINSNFK